MAAEQGIAPAQYALGQMYLNGEGVKPRVEKAVLWYTRAATQGLVEAQADLGYLYATRKNTIPQDTLNAYKWLALAAQHDGKIAKRDLANVMANMSPDQIKEGDQLVQEWKQEHPRKLEN